MRWIMALLLVMILTVPAIALENEIDMSLLSGPMGEQELKLLSQLAKRHEVLIAKEHALNARETELKKREEEIIRKEKAIAWQEAQTDSIGFAPADEKIRPYINMPPSQAAEALNQKTSADAAQILLKISPALQHRILDKMTVERRSEILKIITETPK